MRILSLLILGLLIACGGPEKKAIEKAKFDEVMAVHDAVMPEMGTIRRLKKALEERAAASDSLSGDNEALSNMISELEQANDAMMVWMRAFSKPADGTPHDEVLKYYDSEMVKVEDVKMKMETAIEKAKEM